VKRSFANPAVTIARSLTNTFSGIHPGHAPAFIAAQVVGGIIGYVAANVLMGDVRAAHDAGTAAVG
jgi:glycerol uptake facilitator-like aquaporin